MGISFYRFRRKLCVLPFEIPPVYENDPVPEFMFHGGTDKNRYKNSVAYFRGGSKKDVAVLLLLPTECCQTFILRPKPL